MTQLQFKFRFKDIDELVAPNSYKAKVDEEKTLTTTYGKEYNIKQLKDCGKDFDVLNIKLVVHGLSPAPRPTIISWDEMKQALRLGNRKKFGALKSLFERFTDQFEGVEKVVLGKSLFPLIVIQQCDLV